MSSYPSILNSGAFPSGRRVRHPAKRDSHTDDLRPPSAALAHGDPQAGQILYRLALDAGGWAPADEGHGPHGTAATVLEAARTVYRYARMGQAGAVPSSQAFATVLDSAAGAVALLTWTDTLVGIVRVPTSPADQPAPPVVDGAAVLPPVPELLDDDGAERGDSGQYLAVRPATEGRPLGAAPTPGVEWWSREQVVTHLRGTRPELIAVDRLFAPAERDAFQHDTSAAVRTALLDADSADATSVAAQVGSVETDGGGWR